MSGLSNDTGLSDARLRELAKALPEVAPGPERLNRLLVAARAAPPARTSRWPGMLAATGAAAVAIAYLLPSSPRLAESIPSPWRAHVHVLAGRIDARERSTATGAYEERWFVSDGIVDLEVAAFSSGRFVLSVPDAEIESVGAAMTAIIAQGELVRVELLSGSAEVHSDGRPVMLAPGQSWARSEVDSSGAPLGRVLRPTAIDRARSSRPSKEGPPGSAEAVVKTLGEAKLRQVYRPGPDLIPNDELAVEPEGDPDDAPVFIPREVDHSAEAWVPWARPSPSIFSSRSVDGAPADSVSASGEIAPVEDPIALDPAAAELRFMEGWLALKNGANEAAALIFDDVATNAGTSASLAPEAARWRSIALIRAGADGRAVTSLRRFLARWPEHEAYGEAALLLAERCRDEDEAHRWLKVAALSRDPEIRSRARALLDD